MSTGDDGEEQTSITRMSFLGMAPAREHQSEADAVVGLLDAVKSTPARTPRKRKRFNAELQYSRDAIGTWILLMDSARGEAIPLALYGADRQAECLRVLAVLGLNANDTDPV